MLVERSASPQYCIMVCRSIGNGGEKWKFLLFFSFLLQKSWEKLPSVEKFETELTLSLRK